MNKTISITLNSIMFTLEEDAYKRLDEYLDAIKEYFKTSGDEDDIINDIEASIAEKFGEKLSSKKKVINLQDVNDLIKVMGTIADFKEDADDSGVNSDQKNDNEHKKEHKDKEQPNTKKLFRNVDDAIIAGVCAGLGSFFGVDPIIFRIIFFVTIFIGGSGIFIYIILWIVMPAAKSNTQKLEMQGMPVTLKKIETAVKKKASKIRQMDHGKIGQIVKTPLNFLNELFKGAGSVVKVMGIVITMIIGIALIVASVCAITAIGFAAANLIFNIDSPYLNINLPINELIQINTYYIGVVSGFFVVVIPIFFILLLGSSIAGRKNAFNAITNSLLIGIWMIAIIIFGVIVVDIIPRVESIINKQEQSEISGLEFESRSELMHNASWIIKLN